MPCTNVAVCIPTFRRPIGLRQCLDSIAAQVIDRPIRVIVADNDPDGQEGIAVCNRLRAEGFPFPLIAVSVTERGIAPNRNALVAEAITDPEISLIAMIDDDECADPAWLAGLLSVQAEHDADIVGGPVYRVFEVPVPAYVGSANQANYARIKTGPIAFVDATSNILFRAELFRAQTAPWFDPQYGLMGCEDKDILLGFKIAGARFAWCHEAAVTETMPATRCSARWMIQRAYRVGNTDTIVNLKRMPPGFNMVSESTKILGALAFAGLKMSLFAWHPRHRFEGVRLAARVMGKIFAIFGGRHQEYKIIHGR